MNTLFRINDTPANKISYYHLMALMASLPFDRFFSHLILISLCIHTLINLSLKTVKPIFKLRTLALQSVFFITLLCTIYTINKPEAFNDWGKQIAIFIIPLLFCLNPLNLKKYLPQLLMAFALVCTATIAYLFLDAFITIRHYHLPLSTLFTGYFTNHNFSEPIDIHATFFSMQIAISIIYILSVLIKEREFYYRLFYLACFAMLIAGLVQLSSKSVFAVFVVVINVAIPYFLLQGAQRRRFILISGSVTLLVFAGILSSNNFRARYVHALKNDLSKTSDDEVTDTRLARWRVSSGYIEKSPVIGYGSGSEITLLQDGFFNNKLYDSFLKRLNTHSEYLSFLLKSGIVGLFIYLSTLVWGFTVAFRQKDLLLFTFMALVAIVSISENLLDVDKGVFFYAFFFSFFIFSYELKEQSFVTKISP